MKRNGTTLIELLIYLTLFSFIAMASVHFMVNLWNTMIKVGKKRFSLITLCTAHDVLLRDLERAPCQKEAWKQRLSSSIIWHQHNKQCDIGWVYEKKSLVRLEGNYDITKKRWHKKVQNLIAPAVKKFNCMWHEHDGKIDRIDFEITDELYSMSNRAILLGRPLPWKHKKDQQLSSSF